MAALSFIPSNEEIPVFAKHRSGALAIRRSIWESLFRKTVTFFDYSLFAACTS